MPDDPSATTHPDHPRRQLLQALTTLAGLPAAAAAQAASAEAAAAAPLPPQRPARTPGQPGDFDFLAGRWSIAHRRQTDPQRADSPWDEFSGEATCWTLLGGVGSVEELRIPARNFSGMGLRLLDVEQRVWNDFWVNGRSGVLTTPGLSGSFENGAGIFEADDMDGDQPIRVRGVWDQITPKSCRWHQASSRDGGRTWQPNWFMAWTRV